MKRYYIKAGTPVQRFDPTRPYSAGALGIWEDFKTERPVVYEESDLAADQQYLLSRIFMLPASAAPWTKLWVGRSDIIEKD